jgi:hypothetical protein
MNPANLKDYEVAYLVAVRDGKRVGWHEAAARSTMLIAGYSTWNPYKEEERLTEKGLELLAAHERKAPKLTEAHRAYRAIVRMLRCVRDYGDPLFGAIAVKRATLKAAQDHFKLFVFDADTGHWNLTDAGRAVLAAHEAKS